SDEDHPPDSQDRGPFQEPRQPAPAWRFPPAALRRAALGAPLAFRLPPARTAAREGRLGAPHPGLAQNSCHGGSLADDCGECVAPIACGSYQAVVSAVVLTFPM